MPEDRTKAQADVQAAQQALDAAKKLYDNRVELQKQGALAQKLVDDAKVAMVQAQSQLDTAQRHLQALQQVTSAEQIEARRRRSNAAKAHYDSAAVQVVLRGGSQPDQRHRPDRPVYPGEMRRARHADRFDRRYLAGGGARQYSGEGRGADSAWDARRRSPDRKAFSPGRSRW